MNLTAVVLNPQNNKKQLPDFLNLPKRIYRKNERTYNESEEKAILKGTHTLSHYFSVTPILVYDDKKAVSRAIITVYPNDRTAYLGFFESENNREAAKLLFKFAQEVAAQHGANNIIGPVDASFWIKYRLKTNRFDSPYTGEPYNKDYYLQLWQENGYSIYENYFSNHYMIVKDNENCAKYTSRLADKLNEGYEIKNPLPGDFNKTLQEVYTLLIELYSSFPTYKRITEKEFCEMYGYLKYIINYSMVKMAYFCGKPVGFFISVPNYGNTVYGRLSLPDLFKIITVRKKPTDYVMLYMGVDFNHRGLGKALAEAIRSELKSQGVPSVGALIRKGNCNKDYFAQLVDYEYNYVLLKKEIS